MGTRDKFRTYKSVFDEKTLRVLFKLESDGYFEELCSPISVGKESNVFSARNKEGDYVIVKIYRVNNADFKRMYKYIGCDPRFKGLSNQRRKVIFAWAQREYRNLMIANTLGADVPLPLAVRDNVLVMELIGSKNKAAPRLKDSPPKDLKKFTNKLIKNLKIFYKHGFIHGDLSEFNILNYRDKPYIIDLSHGVKLDYPNVDELLHRDIKNVVKYFNRKGLKLSASELLREVKNGV